MPRSFFRGLSVRSKTHELLRLILRRISELDPWVRITAKRAKCAIGTTPATMDRIQRITQCPLMELSQVAISTDEWLHARDKEQKPIKDKLVFLSAGNLLGLKGYHLSIHAFARADLPDARYVILGDGPEKQNLKVLTRKLGIQDRVEIVGAVPRPEVLKRLGDTDVFLHPSLHDSGGFVTLEAMTAGVPVICLDIGGPAVQVNANVGRKIAAITPDQAIEDLAKAMRELVVDSDLRDRLGEAARQHVASEFTWEKKAEQLSKVYERVLS